MMLERSPTGTKSPEPDIPEGIAAHNAVLVLVDDIIDLSVVRDCMRHTARQALAEALMAACLRLDDDFGEFATLLEEMGNRS